MDKQFQILVVDDEPINLQVISSALKNIYAISTANDGFEAIRQLKQTPPDLILLDVMMPELNGFELCRIIKSDPVAVDIPIIFLTAMDTEKAEKMGLEAGGIDFLAKPVNIDLLKLRVHNHLELKNKNDLIKTQRDRLQEQKQALEETLSRLKSLEGILSICMYCKNIRNEDSSWEQLEKYIEDHTDASFSHGICPECLHENFPEHAQKIFGGK
jgi:response regulator RpfG family c-di-GMP phosphodiesterase